MCCKSRGTVMNKDTLKKNRNRIIAAVIWIIVWQAASVLTGLELVLASPVSVLCVLFNMLTKPDTYRIIAVSMFNIISGYLAAFVIGCISGYLADRYQMAKIFLEPPVALMKSLPMASFIILLIIWFGSGKVAVLTSFIVAFPMIYKGVANGFSMRDSNLLEMAEVFQVSLPKRIFWIDIPRIIEVAGTDFKMAISYGWKAGVSAEVIGLARMSIGEQMYYSKLYIDTASLFAWSIMVVVLSFVWEKLWTSVLYYVKKRLERI